LPEPAQKHKLVCDTFIPFVEQARRITAEDSSKIVFDNGNVYHKDNRLNDLTAREWLKFQKSWFILRPAPREKGVVFHPAKFPEELVSEFVRFFTKQGMWVLDPMAGTGSALVAAAMSGRNAVGVELLEKYAAIAAQRVQRLANQAKPQSSRKVRVKVIEGDAREIDRMSLPSFDYCITSPPYWDMLQEKGFETQRKRHEKNLDVYYSEDPRDLGNLHDYNKFLDELEIIYGRIANLLKRGAYMTIVVKNVKKRGKVYPLAWDIASRVSKFLALKDEKIWGQDDIKLAPYGYRHAWVSNTVHHYCLNFRKE